MKKLLFATLCLVATAFGANAQSAPAIGGASISVNKDTHDYGEIKQGADPYCQFVVKNTGTAPLIISNAQGSCGCTVPEWSQEPVMPGKTTIIKVKYDTQRLGMINKSVTLTSNATNEPSMVLKIKGNISAADAAPATPVAAPAPATPAKSATPAKAKTAKPVAKKKAA
jgi:hypothetical protein